MESFIDGFSEIFEVVYDEIKFIFLFFLTAKYAKHAKINLLCRITGFSF